MQIVFCVIQQSLRTQCHLDPELLCLLCKQQICMDRQAPALLVTATACAHNLPRKRLQQVYTVLHRTQSLLESLMAICSPATTFAWGPSKSGHEAGAEAGNI